MAKTPAAVESRVTVTGKDLVDALQQFTHLQDVCLIIGKNRQPDSLTDRIRIPAMCDGKPSDQWCIHSVTFNVEGKAGVACIALVAPVPPGLVLVEYIMHTGELSYLPL